MTIRREDLDRLDLSDQTEPNTPRLPPVHPGEVLRHDFLDPLGLSVYALANALKVPRARLNEIVRGRRSVTADTALRLARLFGTSADFWLGLQAAHDIEVTRRAVGEKIDDEVRPRAA